MSPLRSWAGRIFRSITTRVHFSIAHFPSNHFDSSHFT